MYAVTHYTNLPMCRALMLGTLIIVAKWMVLTV